MYLQYCAFVISVVGQRESSTFRPRNRIGSFHCQADREMRDAESSNHGKG